jgi:predicted RND superfamily exporter protein
MSNPTLQKHLIFACHLTGIYDVNRNMTLQNDDFSLVKDWAESIADLGLQGVLFHNNFSEETCTKYQSENLIFIKVEHDTTFNPNVFRYLVYRKFLRENITQIEGVFVTDVSDVATVQNPFIQALFTDNPTHIFCGDEQKPLNNEWMQEHSNHLRSKIADYANYEENFKDDILLNCGIIGGNIEVMQEFIEKLANIHQQHNHDNTTAYTGDMGAFNYLIHTQFNDRFFHGSPINTIFKAYQNDRNDCWFRHK